MAAGAGGIGRGIRSRRVVQHPEDAVPTSDLLGEVVFGQVEAQCDGFQQFDGEGLQTAIERASLFGEGGDVGAGRLVVVRLSEVVELFEVGPGFILGVLLTKRGVAEVAAHTGDLTFHLPRLGKGEKGFGGLVGLRNQRGIQPVAFEGHESIPGKGVFQVLRESLTVRLLSMQEPRGIQQRNGFVHGAKIRAVGSVNPPKDTDPSAMSPK